MPESPTIDAATLAALRRAVDRRRLVDTALALCAIPSPTGSAGEVADALAELLARDGFQVERPVAGHPSAPAVAVRLCAPRPGRTLGFDGHLDTVHLPFVPPAADSRRITGSGSADMKSGLAAAVEALRVLRDTRALGAGSVLLTAHDLHEAPWGDGSQLEELIRAGYVPEAVLIPEYFRESLPVVGRGQAVMRIAVRRPGDPIHEVYRPLDEPDVIAAGARLILRLKACDEALAAAGADPLAGRASVFVGQAHSGEIFNQFPSEFVLEGTRRWLPHTPWPQVEAEFHALAAQVARETGAPLDARLTLVREAFRLDPRDPLVAAFQAVHLAACGGPLPEGGKPFVDDGNTYWALARIAAITHGPAGGGAHTLDEWCSIDDLCRVAWVYAATAVAYCQTP